MGATSGLKDEAAVWVRAVLVDTANEYDLARTGESVRMGELCRVLSPEEDLSPGSRASDYVGSR